MRVEGGMTLSDDDILDNNIRREIMILLRDRELRAMEIARRVKRGGPAVSAHLTRLAEAGLLRCRHEGVYRYYGVETQRAFAAWNSALRPRGGVL